MCGFLGELRSRGGVDRASLEARGALLAHRGPDSFGTWVDSRGRAGLHHRRLAIIDLSERGAQPMCSKDGSLILAFNGELYNHRELRALLEAAWGGFRSTSDTEVVLAAYAAWGARCVERMNGMFAFAVIDARSPAGLRVLLARDRLGEKPLFYRLDEQGLQFASEPKALVGRRTLSAGALNCYLALGHTPPDRTLTAEIRKLPPGCRAAFEASAPERIVVERYWAPSGGAASAASEAELEEQAESLLDDAVRSRIQADVPVGIWLSGGLDSGIVAALACRGGGRDLHAFTMAVPGSPLDESQEAAGVARRLGLRHEVIPWTEGADAVFEELQRSTDEPIGDSSQLAAMALARASRRRVKVVLGGDGGDEVFGGYPGFSQALAYPAALRWAPRRLLKVAASVASALPAGLPGRNLVASFREGPLERPVWGRPYFDAVLRRKLLRQDVWRLIDSPEEPESWLQGLLASGRDPVDGLTRMYFGSSLPEDFLVKVDRASMGVGLEVRSPYLDHRLVEFSLSLPSSLKATARATRVLQRRVARRLGVGELGARKQGFSLPAERWLMERDHHSKDRWAALESWVRPDRIRDLEEGMRRGRANGSRLFALMTLSFAAVNNKWTDIAP